MQGIIGISPRLGFYENRKKVFCNQSYFLYFQQLDFSCIILPFYPKEHLLDICDGFILPGGEDVNPEYYHEEKNPLTVLSGKETDVTDLMIIDYVSKSKKPLFGICRGIQIINVYFGGSLLQHIDGHKKPFERLTHQIDISQGRILKYHKKEETVNSYHHQAIDRIGIGINVIARSSDGTVEMIEHEHLPIFAVQFHPELDKDSQLSKYLLETFGNLVM